MNAFAANNNFDPTERPVGYEVTFTRTGAKKTYRTSAAATRAMEKADQAYGACCTVRRAMWAN